ncbi:MAG: WD40 repeat domain-containing protein [Pleurocapsa sp. SU_196_0]|nr:WD40 repeat domain-containing protein [Pleurocapsa sp. SU_196_0]
MNGQLAGFDTTKYAALKIGFTLESGITSLSLGSSLAALTTVDDEVFLWDFKSNKPTLLGKHTDVAISSSWSGDTLYTGGSDANIRVWDGKLKREVRVIRSIGSHANDLSFNAEGTLLASVSSETDILVWDATTGNLKQTLKGDVAWIESVEFAPKGTLLAAGYDDGTVRLYDSATGQLRREIETEESYLNTVGFSPNGKFLVTGGGDGRVQVFDVQSGKSLRTQPESGDSVFEAAWSPDGDLIGVALESGAVARTGRHDARGQNGIRGCGGHGSHAVLECGRLARRVQLRRQCQRLRHLQRHQNLEPRVTTRFGAQCQLQRRRFTHRRGGQRRCGATRGCAFGQGDAELPESHRRDLLKCV